MNPSSSKIGWSRVVAPVEEMNGGFSRLDYQLDGVELNSPRKVRRWFRRNAPLSYIGATLAGLIVVDLVTGGKVKEIVFPKVKKRKR